MVHRVRNLVIGGAVVFALWMLSRLWLAVLPDIWWFNAVGSASGAGYVSVYKTILWTKILVGGLVTALLLTIALFNVWLLHRLAPLNVHQSIRGAMPWQIPEDELRMFARRILYGAAILFSLALGYSATAQWEVILRWLRGAGIGFEGAAGEAIVDPLFGRNVAYYILRFPFEQFLSGWFLAVSLPLAVIMTLVYFFYGAILDARNRVNISRGVGIHLGVLTGVAFIALAWRHWLSRYELLYAHNAKFFGAGYVEHHARLPVLWILTILCVIAAIVYFVGVMTHRLKPAVYLTVLYIGVVIVGGAIYPGIVAQFKVKPNEQALQRDYIRHNIEMTRRAFGLNQIELLEYDATGGTLRLENVMQPHIEKNVRLWDPRPLKEVYTQKQELRSQYNFDNVDIDRYDYGDFARQVSIAAREVDTTQLTHGANTWVNRTFNLTHGFGIVVGPVNDSREGEPTYYVKDIPLNYSDEWAHRIDEEPGPRIYYGERTTHPVIVNPGNPSPVEFDFPTEGNEFAKYTYKGKGGVPIDSLIRRATYAVAFGNYNIILNTDIRAGSRMMYRRTILERVERIAPFLKYDKDPYLVVADGRLHWIIDAYMTSSRFPYSQPLEDAYKSAVREMRGPGAAVRVLPRGIPWGNYLRNSVKVVVDAYDGSTRFYRLDTEPSLNIDDPVLECYAAIFPKLFRPFSEMSDELKKHVRYPLTMFWLQAQQLRAYHMTDPDTFYVEEDLWDNSYETYLEQPIPVEPYYVTMALPGGGEPEFLLIYPFTPKEKFVMSAWMAARCDYRPDADGAQYGQMRIYRFPKGSQMIGSQQWESKFLANEEFSNWKRIQAADVLRGNLLLFPMNQGVLAVEPIYLRSPDTPIPMLRKVMAGYVSDAEGTEATRAVMGEDLSNALYRLLGEGDAGLAVATSDGASPATPGDMNATLPDGLDDLVQEAQAIYDHARSALRSENWAEYGANMDKLGRILKRLDENRRR